MFLWDISIIIFLIYWSLQQIYQNYHEDNIQIQKDSPFDDNSDTTNRILDEESNSSYDEDEMQHKDEESDSYEDDSSYIQDYICLNQHEMNNEVVSSLTSILHIALSLAASENDCNIPVFGIWGAYKGGSIDNSMDSGSNHHQMSKLVEDRQCAAPTWISPHTSQSTMAPNTENFIERRIFLHMMYSSNPWWWTLGCQF